MEKFNRAELEKARRIAFERMQAATAREVMEAMKNPHPAPLILPSATTTITVSGTGVPYTGSSIWIGADTMPTVTTVPYTTSTGGMISYIELMNGAWAIEPVAPSDPVAEDIIPI